MRVGIHHAWRDDQTGGIDFFLPGGIGQMRHFCDAALFYPDIDSAAGQPGAIDHHAAAYDQVIFHTTSPNYLPTCVAISAGREPA